MPRRKTSIRIALRWCLIYCVVTSCRTSAAQPPALIKPCLYITTPEVSHGRTAFGLAHIPAQSEGWDRWDIYAGNSVFPLAHGQTEITSSVVRVELTFENPGVYAPLFILTATNGMSAVIQHGPTIRLVDGVISQIAKSSSGPFIVAIFAVLVFLIQQKVIFWFQKKTKQLELKAKINSALENLEQAIKRGDRNIEIPKWLVEHSFDDWSFLCQSSPYREILSKSISTINQWKAGVRTPQQILEEIQTTKDMLP